MEPTKRALSSTDTLTPAQQGERDMYLKQLARDFPTMPALWREWAVDYCIGIGQEELSRRLATGFFEKKSPATD